MSHEEKIDPVRALDARYYVASDVYEKECRSVLASTWQFACHESQVQEPGDYVCFQVAGENLFCIRTKQGDVNCFYNVCQHRGHELLSDSGNAKLIVCPYHSWTYEQSGALRSGPNISSVKGFDKSRVNLTSVQAENFCGFIFVNLDDNAKPMEEWFPNARTQLKAYLPRLDSLEPLQWVSVTEECNWKISVENYSECYHCKLNHPTFASGVIKSDTYDIQPQGFCLRHTTECQNLERMTYPIDLDDNPYAGSYSSWFLWPMFSFQVYPGNVLNTYHWRPHGHAQVDVIRGWYTPNGKESQTVRDLAKQDRETTVEEDIHLVESVQRGLGSRGYNPGPLVLDAKGGVNSEHSIRALHQWYLEGLDDS
ncbi:MAG: aromatic ring-hydroxylating dioxygenase subunit alpha [Pseudomonadota bacterium]